MKSKTILRDVTGQWILVLTMWCALVFGDLWPNLPGQPSLSPTMAETRAEQDRQNRQEGFEVLPNVTAGCDGPNKFLFKRRWQKSFDS